MASMTHYIDERRFSLFLKNLKRIEKTTLNMILAPFL